MENEPQPSRLVWFDSEFTSLDYEQGRLLQAALIVTDLDLQRVLPPEDDLNLLVSLPADVPVSDWVQEHLGDLVTACRTGAALAVDEVDHRLTDTVHRAAGGTVPESIKLRPVLAGNSVHADLAMARRWLPRLVDSLHYRLLDVSSLKILWRAWRPDPEFDKEDVERVKAFLPFEAALEGRPHDAYYDILASIAELAYYRQSAGWA